MALKLISSYTFLLTLMQSTSKAVKGGGKARSGGHSWLFSQMHLGPFTTLLIHLFCHTMCSSSLKTAYDFNHKSPLHRPSHFMVALLSGFFPPKLFLKICNYLPPFQCVSHSKSLRGQKQTNNPIYIFPKVVSEHLYTFPNYK